MYATRIHPKTDLTSFNLVRLISQSIEIQDTIQHLDLFEEVYNIIKNQLIKTSQRLPNNQELISLLMHDVRQKGSATVVLQRIYNHYQSLQANNPLSTMDESTGPDRRLMNQIYQVSGTLCLDGCQGCLHLGSDIVSIHSSHLMTSRRLLQHFWNFQQKTKPSTPTSTSSVKTHTGVNSTTTPNTDTGASETTPAPSMDPTLFQDFFDGPYFTLMTNIQRISANPDFGLSFEPERMSWATSRSMTLCSKMS